MDNAVIEDKELLAIIEKLATGGADYIASRDLGGWDGHEHYLKKDEPEHMVTGWHIERLIQHGFIQGGPGGWRLSDAGRVAFIKSTDEMGDGKLRSAMASHVQERKNGR